MSVTPTEKRTIVVTGGGRGLGLAIVRKLLESGDDVIACGRTTTADISILQESHGARVRFWEADFPEQSGDLMARIARHERIHALVNNAGVGIVGPHASIGTGDLRSLVDVNLLTPMMLSQGAIRNFMRHRTTGAIVNVSSPATARNWRGYAAYAASKSGVETFTRVLAKEVAPLGISVNCVAPGFIETRMTEGVEKKTSPFRGEPLAGSDVGDVVLSLLMDGSKITGQVIRVDAGDSL